MVALRATGRSRGLSLEFRHYVFVYVEAAWPAGSQVDRGFWESGALDK